MSSFTQKELMQNIVACVGEAEAVKLVSDAFSAEIIANRLGRLEVADKPMAARNRTHIEPLQLALERVNSICELAQS